MYTKAVVFGVFDGLHEGHKYLLNQAQEKARELIAVVTPDKIVQEVKHKTPLYNEQERIEALKNFNKNLTILLGDLEHGTWSVFKEHKPDIVILGYDQNGIKEELEKMRIPYIVVDAHFPEKFKSSLIKREDSK